MKKRIALLLVSSGIVFATAFGATSASWAVTDNAEPFGIKIGINLPKTQHSVKFYTTFDGTSWGGASELEVDDGSTVEAPTIAKTGYTLKGWTTIVPSLSVYAPDYDTDEISSLAIDQDYVFYPIIESNNNKVWIHSLGFVGDVDTDITLSVDSIGQTLIGKDYVGVTNGVCNPIASWNNTRSLHTASGVYKFTNNDGAAQVYRKISFQPNSKWKQSWDGNPSFFIHSWGDTDHDVFLGNGTDLTGYIKATNINFQVVRNSHSKTTLDWSSCNKSGNLSFDSSWWWGGSGTNHYSSSTTKLCMWDEADWDGFGSSNAHWIG